MKRLVIIAGILVFAVIAGGQTLQPTGGGGGGGITVGGSLTGGTANCVLFKNGSLSGCDSGLTYSGIGGASGVIITTTATGSVVANGEIVLRSRGSGQNDWVVTNTGLTQNWAALGSNGGTGGRVTVPANGTVSFSGTTNDAIGSSPDTGISRHATPGVLDIGNGSSGNTVGGLQTGNATLLSLTTGTNADFLCLNAGGGILIQNTACTISSLRFKPDWKPYTDIAITKLAQMDVGTFHVQTGPNADPNAQSLQAGLSAESVAAIAPECAVYENDMKTPKSYRQECVIALLVKAIQELKRDKR